jgi:hypothetical protein
MKPCFSLLKEKSFRLAPSSASRACDMGLPSGGLGLSGSGAGEEKGYRGVVGSRCRRPQRLRAAAASWPAALHSPADVGQPKWRRCGVKTTLIIAVPSVASESRRGLPRGFLGVALRRGWR